MSRKRIDLWNDTDDEPYGVGIGSFNWGDYCFLIYYASKIDSIKTLTIIRMLRGEAEYESAAGLIIQSLADYDPEYILINYNQEYLQEVIDFIANDILPALALEPEFILLDSFSGKDDLEDQIREDGSQVLTDINPRNEYYSIEDGTDIFIGFCEYLKDYFEYVKDKGIDYSILTKL